MNKVVVLVMVLGIIISSCNKKGEVQTAPSPEGYNLLNPVIVHLREDLDEISGINYYAKDNSIFAINDEHGILFKIFVSDKVKIKNWRFSSEADYEDIVLHDSLFYALKSNGDIKAFKFTPDGPFFIETFRLALKGNNEFETLYYDDEAAKFILLCKDCAEDSKKIVSAYSFDPLDNTYSKGPVYQIDAEEIADIIGTARLKFKPSAAAIHPITKDLFILSSDANTLAIADREGTIKEAYKLSPRFFKQPEGITFTSKGDLLISNEAAETGTGNILIFKYKQAGNEKS